MKMPPKPDPSVELVSARKSRIGSATWLTRAARNCEELQQKDLATVPIAEYELCITNFDKRLSAWDEYEQQVEFLVEESEMEAEIEAAAVFREKSEKSRTNLIAAWALKHPVIEENLEAAGSAHG